MEYQFAVEACILGSYNASIWLVSVCEFLNFVKICNEYWNYHKLSCHLSVDASHICAGMLYYNVF